jgi:hypothetical protein
MPSSTLDRSELLAFAELAKARRQLVVNMFTGTQLKFGKAAMASNAKSLLGTGKKLASTGKKVSQGTSMATKAMDMPGIKTACETFIKECADIDNSSCSIPSTPPWPWSRWAKAASAAAPTPTGPTWSGPSAGITAAQLLQACLLAPAAPGRAAGADGQLCAAAIGRRAASRSRPRPRAPRAPRSTGP